MTKTELIDQLAERTGQSKSASAELVTHLVSLVQETVAAGETVTIPGFGSFKSSARAARVGKNPKTGEPLSIAAAVVPKFSAGATFKAAVNSAKT